MPDSDAPEARAHSRALRLLARREKSSRGVARTLRRAGFSSAVARDVVRELEAEGLVDDRRFCRLYLGEQTRLRPRAPRMLRRDLEREGVGKEIVDEVFHQMAEQLEEASLALAAARKKSRAAGSDPDRLRRLLAARGFGRNQIEEALAALEREGKRDLQR